MTANPIPPGPLAVLPVVDYEPPARAVGHRRPPASAHSRSRRPPVPADRAAPVALPPPLRAAAAFADTALRRVLEVVDQRRPPAHLHPLLAPGLADSVLPGRLGRPAEAAVLQRIRVQAIGPDDPPAAVEVFGSYRRGRRTHALACRVQRTPAGAGPAWQVVALHIG